VLYADDSIEMDHFYVYEFLSPLSSQRRRGKINPRHSAFDPPTRHTRNDYLGVEISFRLVRGKTLEQIIDHFKKRTKERENRQRSKESLIADSTLAHKSVSVDIAVRHIHNEPEPVTEYNNTYYLVVRCENQWNPDEFLKQRFAVVVELSHHENIGLYERVRERIACVSAYSEPGLGDKLMAKARVEDQIGLWLMSAVRNEAYASSARRWDRQRFRPSRDAGCWKRGSRRWCA